MLLSVFRHLSVRLFGLILLLLLAAFAAYVKFNYDVHREHLERRITDSAATTSAVIARAARHAMMENDRDHIAQIVESVGGHGQIEAVHIYNKSGEVVHSTQPDEIGQTVDTQAEACSACHLSGDLREVVPTEELARRFRSSDDGHRIVGLIHPILNEPACSAANCHVHPASQRILGVLDVQMSLQQVDADLTASRNEMVRDGMIVSMVTAVGAWLFIMILVRRPVRRLTESARRVGRLDLDVDIAVRSHDEIGELARTFEDMAVQLKYAKAENDRWANSLEDKVQEKADELRNAQSHLVQSEKMASLGKLAAYIAHEINNPLAGVMTYARLVSRRLGSEEELAEDERARLLDHLAMIESETRRCGDTVKNLLIFSRHQAEGLCDSRLVPIVERSVKLVRHRLEMSDISLAITVDGVDDSLLCNVDQVQQVLVALLVNAAEAMPDGGELTISLADSTADAVILVVGDTGAGIPPQAMPHIFEPFFTTKEATSGVGLGLAVVHGIVESHGGRIDVESSPDGTAFRIHLPRRPPRPVAATLPEALQ